MKNVLFLVYTTKEYIHTCFSKHLIIFCNVIFSDWKKSIFINSDFFDIVGLLDEHCVILVLWDLRTCLILVLLLTLPIPLVFLVVILVMRFMKLLVTLVHLHQFQLHNLILSNMNRSLLGLEQLCFQIR